MLNITSEAQQKIAELVVKSENPVRGLRIGAEAKSSSKVDYKLAFISEDQVGDDDERISFEGFDVFINNGSVGLLRDAKVDYVDGLMGSGFKIERSRRLPDHLTGPIAERVHSVIEEKINPGVAAHGGEVSLVDIKDNTVYVKLGGGCQGCGMAGGTLRDGVITTIKEEVPEVEEVVDVTDHASGENPYFN